MLTVACVLAFCVAPSDTQPRPRGSLGFHAELPPIVGNEFPRRDDGSSFGVQGMTGTCPEFRLAAATLNADDHELEVGAFNLSHHGAKDRVTVLMPRDAVPLLRVRDERGAEMELWLRRVCPRPMPLERQP